jgi:hypothetical protein
MSSNPLIEVSAGAFAASVDCVAFHWVDTLKVRAQDRRPLLPYDRLRGRSILRGFTVSTLSLYAGFTTNFALKVPYMAFMFGANSINQLLIGTCFGDQEHGKLVNCASAVLTGLQAAVFLAPLELLRIQGQNCGKGEIIHAARYLASLSKQGGPLLMFRGFGATAARESKYCFGQFFLQVEVERLMAQWRRDQGWSDAAIGSKVASASVVGFFCGMVSHPHDVIKTRMQTHLPDSPDFGHYRTYFSTLRRIKEVDGVRGFFSGSFFRCCIRIPLGLPVVILASSHIRPQMEELVG